VVACGRRYAPPRAWKAKAGGSRSCPGIGSLPGARTRERTVDLLWQGGGCREERVGLKIRIARKGQGLPGFYVGRPTPLGNPYRLVNEQHRDQVVSQYATWLDHQVKRGNPEVVQALEELYRALKRKGDITLICFCAPRRCHAEVIAGHLKRRALEEGLEVEVEVVGRK
jgi:peptidoglycan/xylan/chitin deacetylase (PgdA/CDA1 family)